jgi:LPXTG-motif cell wall-anchored protein
VISLSRHTKLIASAAFSAAVFLAWGELPVSAANDPPPGSPGWYARETSNWVGSTGRLQDQLSNPEYWALRTSQKDTTNADPYRAPERWAPERGRVIALRYPNRYGAMISAHLWAPPAPFVDPVTRQRHRGPYPAVIVINGSGDTEEEYWSFAEDLAEHGHVVMTFDPQGAGASDDAPNPEATYCDPNGTWREPQELGVREHGSCAGENDNGVNSTVGQVPAVAGIAVGGRTGSQGTVDVQSLYEQLEPNFIFGAFDADGWLASRANPWRNQIDFDRVGLIGHSLGAYAAAMVANGDPLRRFRAAVALDSYGTLMHGVRPRVPTLFEQSEQELFAGPRLAPPRPEALHATRRDYAAFVARRIATMYVVLASSTHQEFAYVGPEGGAPASRYGQRVATYFALGWLDRYLKGARLGPVRDDERVQRDDAGRRLLARRFDRSVDLSSTGLGMWDLAGVTNTPYHIAGEPVASALSSYYVSRYAFDRNTCVDIRAACPRPPGAAGTHQVSRPKVLGSKTGGKQLPGTGTGDHSLVALGLLAGAAAGLHVLRRRPRLTPSSSRSTASRWPSPSAHTCEQPGVDGGRLHAAV